MGAFGRYSRGAGACCSKPGIVVAEWNRAETVYRLDGFYPETLQHDIFLNAVLAAPEMGHSGVSVMINLNTIGEKLRLLWPPIFELM